jgi:uncharacterized membrane protein YgdD (TMEM256/DUF423 family)
MSTVGGRITSVGAISAALAVAVGAFGAHALEGRVPADLLVTYETGARYHFYHSLGLVCVGLLTLLRGAHAEPAAIAPGDAAGNAALDPAMRRLRWSAALMATGIVLFSGSLYVLALTGMRWLGAVTPLGGVSFLAAWALLAWAALDS